MYFSTTLVLLLVVVNIIVYCLRKLQDYDYKGNHKPSSSLDKQRSMQEEDHGEKNDSSSSLCKQRLGESSSSSSQLNPASVSQSWNHEVFLSFRGEDTRKNFVDHLYEALKRQGIQTYKDDETLARGETVRPALLKAIEESQIAIIVFSKNYADSSWCLDELAHIIECKDKIKQIVIPVFYDVDPSDVRKQNGKYGEAFTKHERENKQEVDLWREALVKAGNISGLVPRDFANGHEAQCIKSIVATISKTRLQDLKSMLKIGSGDVRMVGIWGVGGAGKTTLASATYMEFSRQFDACCFLENIREESSKHGLTKLQEKFLSLVAKTNEAIGSEMEGRSMIEKKLRHKRVLVVLDDVNDRKQLEVLAGAYDWFGKGSRIIITTKDKHLLTLKNATIYEVSLLSDAESLKLFSRHAFQKDEPVEDYKTLSQKVVSYASRLPLALEILGSSLYDQDKEVWKCTLAKLEFIPETEVMERLKISFDGLKHEEKELFLDIACFFRRTKIDWAMQVLEASSFYPCRLGVKVLTQKSMIKVSEGRFEMHDLVEEMAHYIVGGEHPDNPEKLSRIWKRDDIDNLCSMGADVSAMETQVLALRDYQGSESIYVDHPRLLDVIGKMKKLWWIDWEYYPPSSFSSNFQPTKLGCLMLRESKLTQLWEDYKILPNLKILNLSFSRDLMTTPDFKGLPHLEQLILVCCYSLEDIHPSIGNHERLVLVNMSMCTKLKRFPPIIQMKKLETLDLSQCRELHMFPDIQTNMESLVNLHLQETGIKIIPPSVGEFCTNLVYFGLQKCGKLKRIEGNFRLLKRLKYLQLNESDQLEKLAGDFFDNECCLKVLSLSVSPKLPQFPCFLIKLYLRHCKLGDGDIPSDMNGLLNLQLLDLSHNNFSRLPSSFSKIPCLKFLDLSYCQRLEILPDLPSSIAILIAEHCGSLQSLGDLSNCKWLWKVYLLESLRLTGVERVVHSMLERNAVEDGFMSIVRPYANELYTSAETITMTLQLPHNWSNDFSGFLLSAYHCNILFGCRIYIKQVKLSMDSQHNHDHWEEFENPESFKEGAGVVAYVPFASLRQTSWWNPAYTHITFEFQELYNPPKVGLVPRKSISRERPIDYSKCWEEEIGYTKTFQIEDHPLSSEI